MNSFTDTVKKHGLIIWLSHFFAALITYGVIYFLVIGGVLIAFGIGVSSMYSMTMEKLMTVIKELPPVALGGTALVVGLAGILVYLLAYSFGEAGTIAVTANAVSEDEANIRSFFQQGLKNMWRMLGLGIVSLVAYIPAILAGGGAAYTFWVNHSGIGFLLGFAAVVLGILGTLALLFAQYILIAENASIGQSLRGSFSLFTKAFGEVFVTGLILFGLGLVSGVSIFVSGFGGETLHHAVFHPVNDFLISPLVMALMTLVVTYRYFKYLRPILYPSAIEVENAELVTDGNDEMDKTEY